MLPPISSLPDTHKKDNILPQLYDAVRVIKNDYNSLPFLVQYEDALFRITLKIMK